MHKASESEIEYILWAEINPLIKIFQFNIKSGLVDLLKECLKKLLLLFEDMESSSHISTHMQCAENVV